MMQWSADMHDDSKCIGVTANAYLALYIHNTQLNRLTDESDMLHCQILMI